MTALETALETRVRAARLQAEVDVLAAAVERDERRGQPATAGDARLRFERRRLLDAAQDALRAIPGLRG